eukprot:1280996-Prorocentrum_lima.AAC.1
MTCVAESERALIGYWSLERKELDPSQVSIGTSSGWLLCHMMLWRPCIMNKEEEHLIPRTSW